MDYTIAMRALICTTLMIAGSASAVLNTLEGDSIISMDEAEGLNLTIYHLNTHWVTGSTEYINDPGIWANRVAFVAAKVLEAEAELVCLSEVFADEEIAGLKEFLGDHYPYIYAEGGKEGSGLFIASKRPIDDLKFIPFSCQASDCTLGFFEGKIQGKDGKSVRVCFAQLQPFRAYDRERLSQVEQIIEHIKSQKDALPTLLCGNFGLEPGAGEAGEYVLNNWLQSAQVVFNPQNFSKTPTAATKLCKTPVRGISSKKNEPVRSPATIGILFCGGNVSADTHQDSNGNSSVDGRFEYSGETKTGSYSFEVEGRVSEDRYGNRDAEMNTHFEFKW